MRKITKTIVAIIVAVMFSGVALGQTLIDGIWYNLSDSTAEVTNDGDSYGCYNGKIVIPSTVTHDGVDYKVTSIGDYTFKSAVFVTSVTISEGITHIGKWAFKDCRNATFTLPESITSIGDYAFSSCRGITSFTIPKKITNIGNCCFEYCENLTSISIPENVVSIGEWAFRYCKNLSSITIPSSVTFVGYLAFHNTLWYDNQPNGLIYINKILYGYKGTMPENTHIEVKKGTIHIASGAFYNYGNLASISIPEGTISIGCLAFFSCSGLTEIVIPPSVMSIGSTAFSGCSGLVSIIIPDGVVSIENTTFSCRNLSTIFIPSNVKNIEDKAFAACVGITSITNLNPEPVSISSAVFSYIPDLTINQCKLIVPTNAVSSYQEAEVWKNFDIVGGGFLVHPTVNTGKYGYVTGNNLYENNATATVTAVANSEYKFVNWTRNGEEVSFENPYNFEVTEDVKLVANFIGTNANLQNLSVNDYFINPDFNSEILDYTLHVPFVQKTVYISAEQTDTFATISSENLGNKILSIGKNIIEITVTAEDGVTQKTYTITIIREPSNCTDKDALNYNPLATADDKSCEYDPSKTPETVVINGVIWATRNVDAFGTFAQTSQDAGMFYQWNRKTAWSATDDVTGWDSSMSAGIEWEKANDPSPAGYRVASNEEYASLLDANKVTKLWTAQNGINGYRFTDKATGASIFFPAVGCYSIYGIFANDNTSGYYWSGSDFIGFYAYLLVLDSTQARSLYSYRMYGLSVRSVVDNNIYGCIDENAENYNQLATRDDASCQYDPTKIPETVEINGVTWATRNVNTAGTFTETPQDAGMFYQWNSTKAWATIGDAVGWDNSPVTATLWEKENDPCPQGFRVPTFAEITSLAKVDSKWVTQNGVVGRIFGSGVNSIFLPAAGLRYDDGGTLDYANVHGYYWSAEVGTARDGRGLAVHSGGIWAGDDGKRDAFSLRCVKDVSITNIYGCTDKEATNYNPLANQDDKSCIYPVKGCTNNTAENYNPLATKDDASCQYTVTVSVAASAGGTVSGGGVFTVNATATVNALTANGYRFVEWQENGVRVSTEANYTFTVSGVRNLTCVFESMNVFQINVTSIPTGAGLLDGGGSYFAGNEVLVSAFANSGYTFVNWIENGEVISKDNIYSFTASNDRNLIAVFTERQTDISGVEVPAGEGIIVIPEAQGARIVWNDLSEATGYKLLITDSNGVLVCTLEFNDKGQLVTLVYTPNALKSNEVFGIRLTNLAANTTYHYTMEIFGNNNTLLETKSGTFTTKGTGVGIEETWRAASLPRVVGYFTLLGQKLPQEPAHGVYIIMYDNGTSETRVRK